MLTELGYIQHYSYVKSISALLYDQTQHNESKHYCLLCLTGFSKKEILEEQEKHCNGINGRPTRIEMPKETDSHLYFKNYQSQQKVPFVIYADLEAIVEKMQGCELPNKQKSYTEKTSHHAAKQAIMLRVVTLSLL